MDSIPTPEELVTLFNNGTISNEMANSFSHSDDKDMQIVLEQCAALHNNKTLDFLQLVENNSIQELTDFEFFSATQFFCQLLPEIETTSERMMTCVESLVHRGGEDMMANQPNAAFRHWCAKTPQRAHDIIAASRSDNALANRHLTFALEAIGDIAEVHQIAREYTDIRRVHAITALGRIPDNDSASRTETLSLFLEIHMDDVSDDTVNGNILKSTAAILSQSDDKPSTEAIALIRKLVQNAGDFTLFQAAHVIWAYDSIKHIELIDILLEALIHLNPEHKATINEVDHSLHSLMKNGHEQSAIEYVTKVLTQQDTQLKLNDFDRFTHKLVATSPEYLSRVVIK